MNSEDQAAGEKRVQEILIDPCLKLGMTKHSTLTKAAFEEMLKSLRQMLSYMTADNLIDLRDKVQANPAGPDRDRFPKSITILPWAHGFQEPVAGPSPLIRKVMTGDVGKEALANGWAPELLDYVKADRKWPKAYSQSLIKRSADNPMRRLEDIELRLSRNDHVTPEECAFRSLRRAAIQRCQDIADLAHTESAA